MAWHTVAKSLQFVAKTSQPLGLKWSGDPRRFYSIGLGATPKRSRRDREVVAGLSEEERVSARSSIGRQNPERVKTSVDAFSGFFASGARLFFFPRGLISPSRKMILIREISVAETAIAGLRQDYLALIRGRGDPTDDPKPQTRKGVSSEPGRRSISHCRIARFGRVGMNLDADLAR